MTMRMGTSPTSHRPGRAAADRGAALVEFALSIPIIIILVVGIIEMGWMGLHFSEVWSAAREGARHAATVGDTNGDGVPNFADCDDIRSMALARASVADIDPTEIAIEYLLPDGGTFACDGTPVPTDLPPGTRVTVTVFSTYDALGIPLVGNIFDGVDLSSTSSRSIQSGWEFG